MLILRQYALRRIISPAGRGLVYQVSESGITRFIDMVSDRRRATRGRGTLEGLVRRADPDDKAEARLRRRHCPSPEKKVCKGPTIWAPAN